MGTTTSLWAVIDAMQRRLESEGFSERTADAAVTQGLARLLHRSRRPRAHGARSLLAPVDPV